MSGGPVYDSVITQKHVKALPWIADPVLGTEEPQWTRGSGVMISASRGWRSRPTQKMKTVDSSRVGSSVVFKSCEKSVNGASQPRVEKQITADAIAKGGSMSPQ
jgi:hypothetical protein